MTAGANRWVFWVAGALAAGALATAGPASAAVTRGALVGDVGPGFSIVVENPHGRLVRRLEPGRYRVTVHDRSAQLDFHLFGPGVSKRTPVVGTGTFHWLVTLRKGLYRYQCDAHATIVSGSFRVV